MKKCAVIIGVNKTGGLPCLSAAVSGAIEFKAWADQQQFDSILITDESKKVAIKDIQDAVKYFVDKQVYAQMIVFFSGHGILKSATDEHWLLSDAPTYANETVNVIASKMLARRTGIPHIVFISDACRSIPNDPLVTEVIGSSIFPVMRANGTTDIDMFYSTMPGSPSYEASEDLAVANFKGLYTSCLLKAIRGEVTNIIQNIRVEGESVWVIPAYELKEYLRVVVPEAATAIHITLSQMPDGEITSRLPKYISRAKSGETTADLVTKGINTRGEISHRNVYAPRTSVSSVDDFSILRKDVEIAIKKDKEIEKSFDIIRSAGEKTSFEVQTGFSIIGIHEYVILFPKLESNDIYYEQGTLHIRIPEYLSASTLLLGLPNGNAVPLAILPGFIGTVVFRKDVLVNVNYFANGNVGNYPNVTLDDDLEYRRALVATSAYLGLFRLNGNVEETFNAISYSKNPTDIDHTMSLYASYAYAQTGRDVDVRSVYNFMAQKSKLILYDISMLNMLCSDPFAPNMENIAPFCPLLTQGWSYVSVSNKLFPSIFSELGRHLAPGLWTTFQPKGVELITSQANNIMRT